MMLKQGDIFGNKDENQSNSRPKETAFHAPSESIGGLSGLLNRSEPFSLMSVSAGPRKSPDDAAASMPGAVFRKSSGFTLNTARFSFPCQSLQPMNKRLPNKKSMVKSACLPPLKASAFHLLLCTPAEISFVQLMNLKRDARKDSPRISETKAKACRRLRRGFNINAVKKIHRL